MEYKNIGILGNGEVGRAIGQFYDKVYVADVSSDGLPDSLDVLHVCIPPVGDFHSVVCDAIDKHKPALVIIHTSTPVGWTKRVFDYFPMTVHSPIRGVHPHLHEGIRAHVKFVGADSFHAGRAAAEHLKSVGMRVVVLHQSKTTELGKLIDTTKYGADIALNDWASDLCKKEGVNFDSAILLMDDEYNKGYARLKMKSVTRPLLYPAGGKIGGHCVIPNAEILKEQYGSNGFIDEILKRK